MGLQQIELHFLKYLFLIDTILLIFSVYALTADFATDDAIYTNIRIKNGFTIVM